LWLWQCCCSSGVVYEIMLNYAKTICFQKEKEEGNAFGGQWRCPYYYSYHQSQRRRSEYVLHCLK
ncbi:MAG: hypothetical protein V2I33_26150, partial [Kangiellaceae bacterium]|nr:hypothetical protein [Kangiellaceae bacterium]